MSRKRLIVIDDDPRFRGLVSDLFSADFEIEGFDDFAAAEAACRENPPDLVLCDVCIPRMGGLAIVAALAGDEVLRHVPVLVVSSLSLAGPARLSFTAQPNVRGIVDKLGGLAAFKNAVSSAVR